MRRLLLTLNYLALCIVLMGVHLFTQTPGLDYNSYYRFPFSVGIEYQSLSPFSDYAAGFNIYDLSLQIKRPLSSRPELQPGLRLGLINFDSQDQDDPLEWDHRHWYALVTGGYSHRFEKNFEVGGEFGVGLSQAVYLNLIPDEGPVGSRNLLLEAGAKISLDPSYALSIDIHPNLRYLYSLGYLRDFDGFIFGIGFAVSYRFGDDPDAAGSTIRSIRFGDIEMPNLYSAMQSYYVDHPFASVVLTNTESHEIEDLQVSFFQAGYMDTPTPLESIAVLAEGERVEVPLRASFNREVFSIEGVTPVTAEIIVTYSSMGRVAEQRQSLTYDLHDKTSIVWDDDRKVAAFITPADGALRNYASFIRQSCKESEVVSYSGELQFAMQLFHALGELGCIYQVDPVLPFTKVKEDGMIVDSINLPRNTLVSTTGDCDDLTVLFCSLLETVGIESAFITVPGHIYAAVNTRVPSSEYRSLHPDRSMTISLDGELWVPVEITMISQTSFFDAWESGMKEWRRYNTEPQQRAFYRTRESQEVYRPVGLTEKDLGLQYGDGKAIEKAFSGEIERVASLITGEYKRAAELNGSAGAYNRLGISLARFGDNRRASDAFREAIRREPGIIGARVNLANLQFLEKNYEQARKIYLSVYEELRSRGMEESSAALKILINTARASSLLGEYEQAEIYLSLAKDIDPDQAEEHSYLTSRADAGGGRASEQPAVENTVIFLEEE
jgi:hypothetical protein